MLLYRYENEGGGSVKYTKTSALKTGLDGMPDGICCSKDDGKPVFINEKMKFIMRSAFITGAKDARVFENPDNTVLKDGCKTVKSKDSLYLLLPNESAWSIKTGKIKVNKKEYNECKAYDVTELYKKSLELIKRNDHTAKVNEKIRQYSKSMDSIIRDRELLDAKIRIHDDVGRALLSLKSYLNRVDKDRESLVKLWRYTISVLRRETAADVSGDRMEALTEAAKAVDVTLHFDGEIPDDTVIREISSAAIRECLTNTVKHAQGHNVYINSAVTGGTYVIKIKNDGKQPEKQIEESGGLHTLRRSVQRCGGEMNVEWENGFILTITLG